jgi:hypothetical protein
MGIVAILVGLAFVSFAAAAVATAWLVFRVVFWVLFLPFRLLFWALTLPFVALKGAFAVVGGALLALVVLVSGLLAAVALALPVFPLLFVLFMVWAVVRLMKQPATA